MNKTVTINISGIIFHIEEDAYQNLSGYLAALKMRFAAQQGGAEILADIEARIAELMQEKVGPSKQVLVNDDVEVAKATMGRPEDLGGDEPASAPGDAGPADEQIKRRFFRDPDDRVIGGVCSGLAAYFDIDRVWVRLAMFLLIFFGGLSLWVYVILWIVIPMARTTAEKLAMRGKPANINTIMRNFRDEAEEVKTRFTRQGGAYGERVRDNLSGALATFFNIVGRLFGLLLLFIGGVLLLAYVAAITGVSLVDMNSNVANWKTAIFGSSFDYNLAVVAFMLVAGIPIFLLLYAGIKLLFRVTYSNRWLGFALGIAWVAGIALGLYVTVKTVQQFSESTQLKEQVPLDGIGDTLVIRVKATPEFYPLGLDADDDGPLRHGHIRLSSIDRKISVVGAPGIDIVESHDGRAELQIVYESRGADKREAYSNAQEIRYRYERQGNVLVFDENFVVPGEARFRDQEVFVRLILPPGKVVMIERSAKDLLHDVDNTSQTWDGDMAGRRWKMTERGLECVDCDNLRSIYDDHDDLPGRRRRVHVGHEGIHVKSDDEEVKIDRHGVEIRSNRDRNKEEGN